MPYNLRTYLIVKILITKEVLKVLAEFKSANYLIDQVISVYTVLLWMAPDIKVCYLKDLNATHCALKITI